MTENSSPTKYDGYSAYLSTLPSTTTTFPNTANKDYVTPQKIPQENNNDESPPFTPSTPPPPPPLPSGGLPPLSKMSGSFAEAVKPIKSAGGESSVEDAGGGGVDGT
jgi:hypothetical protein